MSPYRFAPAVLCALALAAAPALAQTHVRARRSDTGMMLASRQHS